MRAAKMYCALPERDTSNLTAASSMANYIPNAGDLFFANSWLPHSFPRNESKEPLKFIHFNINVIPRKSVPMVI